MNGELVCGPREERGSQRSVLDAVELDAYDARSYARGGSRRAFDPAALDDCVGVVDGDDEFMADIDGFEIEGSDE